MEPRQERKGSGGPRRHAIAAAAVAALMLAVVGAPSAAPLGVVKFRTPVFPTGVVSGYGAIWVSTHRDRYVYRINPRTNRIAARIDVGQDTCWLGASGGRVFAGNCEPDGPITRVVNPHTNKVVDRLRGIGAVVGGDSLWVLRDVKAGVLVRLDPKTHVLIKRFRVKASPDRPAWLSGYAYGSLWLGGFDFVEKIDGATNTRTLVPLPGAKTEPSPNQGFASAGPMAFAGGKGWIGNPAGIFAVDSATNTATLYPIRIGNLDQWGNIDMASGLGSVWARTSGMQATRIDPATGEVVGHYRAAGGGGGVAAAFGSLWVTNAGLDSVWREPAL